MASQPGNRKKLILFTAGLVVAMGLIWFVRRERSANRTSESRAGPTDQRPQRRPGSMGTAIQSGHLGTGGLDPTSGMRATGVDSNGPGLPPTPAKDNVIERDHHRPHATKSFDIDRTDQMIGHQQARLKRVRKRLDAALASGDKKAAQRYRAMSRRLKARVVALKAKLTKLKAQAKKNYSDAPADDDAEGPQGAGQTP